MLFTKKNFGGSCFIFSICVLSGMSESEKLIKIKAFLKKEHINRFNNIAADMLKRNAPSIKTEWPLGNSKRIVLNGESKIVVIERTNFLGCPVELDATELSLGLQEFYDVTKKIAEEEKIF